MNFRKFLNYFKMNESSKEKELNRILDKISNNNELTDYEKNFLNKFNNIEEDDIKDYKLLSRQSTFERIKYLLNKSKKVICNLQDRDGKIGLPIITIINNFEEETCIVTFKNGSKTELKDNFLYNIYFDIESDTYSLEKEDEYFEKIPIKND